jgi:hypothetical protein
MAKRTILPVIPSLLWGMAWRVPASAALLALPFAHYCGVLADKTDNPTLKADVAAKQRLRRGKFLDTTRRNK